MTETSCIDFNQSSKDLAAVCVNMYRSGMQLPQSANDPPRWLGYAHDMSLRLITRLSRDPRHRRIAAAGAPAPVCDRFFPASRRI